MRVATYNIHRCRGMDRRVRPERIAAVLATIDPDVVALQEVIGPGLTGPGQAEATRRRARHGLGDGPDARTAAPPVRQRRAQPLSHPRTRADRPVLEDLRAAVRPARGDRPRHGRRRSTSTTRTWARRCSNGATRPRDWPTGSTTDASCGPRIVLGDFNEWGRGLVADVLAERPEQHRPLPAPAAAAHLSGVLSGAAPRPHLLFGPRRDPAAWNCRGPGWRWWPPTTCRSSPTCGSVRKVGPSTAHEAGSLRRRGRRPATLRVAARQARPSLAQASRTALSASVSRAPRMHRQVDGHRHLALGHLLPRFLDGACVCFVVVSRLPHIEKFRCRRPSCTSRATRNETGATREYHGPDGLIRVAVVARSLQDDGADGGRGAGISRGHGRIGAINRNELHADNDQNGQRRKLGDK